MPMQARRVQVVVARDLRRRLTRSEQTVNFGPFEVVTRDATFTHDALSRARKGKLQVTNR